MSGDPPKAGIFGWWSQKAGTNGSAGGSTGGTAVSDEPAAPLAVGNLKRPKPRKDSSSMTHDEALNISRANSKGPSSPILTGQGRAQGRARSNSKYDKLGLMAAYSAGPSSF